MFRSHSKDHDRQALIVVIMTINRYINAVKELFSDQLRRAIDRSGYSHYRICQLTGIDKAALSRFYNRKRGLPIDSIDALCRVLGAQLVTKPRQRKIE